MSTALVVVESMWGNTRAVADVVAAGLGHECPVLDVSEAPTTLPDDLRLLVVGGPTHALSMTRQRTREGAVEQGAHDAHTELGIREWLASLPTSDHIEVATFDTKVGKGRHFAGSAARAAGKSVRRHHLGRLVASESFYVAGTEGPLLPGELNRARAWGAELAVTTSLLI
jgi:hypothetical protein